MKNYAIILASGTGNRFGGDIPKQFTKIGDKSIFEQTVSIFDDTDEIDEIIVVVTPNYVDYAKKLVQNGNYKKISRIVAGGEIRKESSYIGINSIRDEEANVLIHDCARPFISKQVIKNCIRALENHSAAGVAIPSTDTIIEVENGIIKSIPPRKALMRVQTPQCFKLSLIRNAHELSKNDSDFTDDCGLVVKYHLADVYIVEGDRNNIKITYPEDILMANAILAAN